MLLATLCVMVLLLSRKESVTLFQTLLRLNLSAVEEVIVWSCYGFCVFCLTVVVYSVLSLGIVITLMATGLFLAWKAYTRLFRKERNSK